VLSSQIFHPGFVWACGATGEMNDTVLKSKVVNAYGDEQSLGDIQLSGEDFLERGEIQYGSFGKKCPTR
jgi:hypothetical protein